MSRVGECDHGRRRGFALAPALLAGLLCLAALTPCPLLAQTDAAEATQPPNRCLLVVETSRSMQRRADGVVQAVKDLLKSGLGRQLRPRDTLGVWTYNESLYTRRFPLQTWSPEAREGITLRTVAFLKEQKYEKLASFDKVLPALTRLIQDSPLITIIIISSAEEKMHGTPFDTQINEFYQKWQDAQQKARMPFVTVLRARDGRLADFTVNTPLWPVQMPRLPQDVQQTETVQSQVPKAVRTFPPPIAKPLIFSGKKAQPEAAPAPKPEPAGVTVQAPAPVPEAANANKSLAANPLAPPATVAQIAKPDTALVVPEKPSTSVSPVPPPAPMPVPEVKAEVAKGPETKTIAPAAATPEVVPALPPPAPELKPAASELPKPAPAPESKPTQAPKPVIEPKVEIAKGPEPKPVSPAPLKVEPAQVLAAPTLKPASAPTATLNSSAGATAARPVPSVASTAPTPPVQTAIAVPPGTLAGRPIAWIAGLVLIGVAIGFAFWLRRRSHATPGASLITQSFERKNKP